MSNVPLSDEQDSSDGKFNLGSMFTYKNLRSTTTQMNNPSVIGDFSINTDSNHTGSDISGSGNNCSGVTGINRDGSRLQGDTNTTHSGIFMAFAPNVFKDMARGKDMSDIRCNHENVHEEVEEVDCRDQEQPDNQQLDEQPVELNETTKINGSKKSATKVKLKRPDEYSDDLTQGYSEYNLDEFISSVFTDPKALAEYEKYTAERGQYRFWENNDFSENEVPGNRHRDANKIVSFMLPTAYGSENSELDQQDNIGKRKEISWLYNAYKACKGDRSQEILEWQNINRLQASSVATFFDEITNSENFFNNNLQYFKLSLNELLNHELNKIDAQVSLSTTDKFILYGKKLSFHSASSIIKFMPESTAELRKQVLTSAAGCTVAYRLYRIYKFGEEFAIPGTKSRVAPFGNRTGHKYGKWPHYHRRVADPKNPNDSLPGQGIGRHRPWELPVDKQGKSLDKKFTDRF